mgnify:CR=1 FL=1
MAMKEEIYKEVGANYRFFLGWRHALVAGYLIVLGAALSLCISAFKDAREIVWLIPIGICPIGVIFWAIEVRTRDLYHTAINAGKDLEVPENGFYAHLAGEVVQTRNKSPLVLLLTECKLTQAAALNGLFLGGSLLLLLLSIYLFGKYGPA